MADTTATQLLLVDGNSIAWRAYHAGGKMLSYDGKPTGMAFTFLRMIRTALHDTDARRCCVVWDGGQSQFRKQVFPAYKSGRPMKDRQVKVSFDTQAAWLSVIMGMLGIESVSYPGWEADDAIALVAIYANGTGGELVIFSGDGDMWQLLACDHTKILSPVKGIINRQNFTKKTSFQTPEHSMWYKVLVGDSSDSIPGVKGVGKVHGRRLIAQGWPDYFTEPNDTMFQRVKSSRAIIERNYRLINLHVSARVLRKQLAAGDAHPIRWLPDKDLAAARAMIEQMGMHSLIAGWRKWSEPFQRMGE